MAIAELTALDNAYQALQPLGQAARRRALQWLSDALVSGNTLFNAAEELEVTAAAAETAAVSPVAVDKPARQRKAAAVAKRATAAAPKTLRGRRVKGVASQASAATGRPYRRMPDPEAIMKAYRKVGSVSGLAEQFDVPRHTADHWARRLRGQGYDIGRTS